MKQLQIFEPAVRVAMPTDPVQKAAHYNGHPSGLECIVFAEKMTFNLGNALKYVWRGGLKSEDATQDFEKALWYVERSYHHDAYWLMGGQAAEDFRIFLAEDNRARRLMARPSPWSEPIRFTVGGLLDLHAGRMISQRIEIYERLRDSLKLAICDEQGLGQGLCP